MKKSKYVKELLSLSRPEMNIMKKIFVGFHQDTKVGRRVNHFHKFSSWFQFFCKEYSLDIVTSTSGEAIYECLNEIETRTPLKDAKIPAILFNQVIFMKHLINLYYKGLIDLKLDFRDDTTRKVFASLRYKDALEFFSNNLRENGKLNDQFTKTTIIFNVRLDKKTIYAYRTVKKLQHL